MKATKKKLIFVLLMVFLYGFLAKPLIAEPSVKMWEEPLVLKSYIVERPDPNPRFYEGLGHQGVQRHGYPYRVSDVLTDDFEEKSYRAFYLDNEYVNLCIIPELGGRIYSAVDKTNNYEFFYRLKVFKPALIGMVGAWIAGGNAWGFPHHHGPTTIAPFDYRLSENPDGRRTIWVAKTDLRHRMRMLLGISLYPGKSYIELSAVLNNRTPIVNSMLFWANPSVLADPSYQIFFDPSVEYVTYHHKTAFTRWPIASGWYVSADYTGVDISWWKNVKRPGSFFSWKPQGGYFGGYSHGHKAGVAYVGNHHIMPGMKIWAHGPNPEGDMWRNMLTDTDDHYIELMAGAYTDNQPDYSWMQPYEIKTFRQIWFPIREMGGLKYANIHGALNLELAGSNTVKVRLNTTSRQKGAKVVLEAKGKTIFERIIDISPAWPYGADVEIVENIKETDLRLSLFSSDGEQLLSFEPVEKPGRLMPEVVVPPSDPKDFKSVEELYVAGLRLDQFYNAKIDPYPYYAEALRRDPRNSQVNTHLGILYCKRKMWKQAEEKLRIAIDRLTYNYTRPKSGEAYYYLGVALRAQGKIKDAYDAFYNATWDAGWYSPAYYQLAELDCQTREFSKAIEHLERSISSNAKNVKLKNLKAIVLRKLGKLDLAEKQAVMVAEVDLLDFQSRNELYILKSLGGQPVEANKILAELKKIMRDDVESYLELAVEYGNCGFYDEAIDILSRIDVSKHADGNRYAMVYYYLGYYWAKKGDKEKAEQYYRIASEMPVDYCFPYRVESIDVLKHAQEVNPQDWVAPYCLGNLLYDHQPAEAIKEWEKARALNDKFYIVHRNLGWGYDRYENDVPKAIASLEKAVECCNEDARVFYELDLLYEKAKVSPLKRINVLEKNHDTVVKRDDALSREVLLYVQLGKFGRAMEILGKHHFNRWEGSRFLRALYEDAYQIRGIRRFKAGKYPEALIDFEKAFEYPENLDEGRPLHNQRFAKTFYLIGTGYEAVGKDERAEECFERAIAENAGNSEYLYYQGLAYKKLGRSEEADKAFNKLTEFAESSGRDDYYEQFATQRKLPEIQMARRHYLLGLAYLGKGEKEQSKAEFAKAVELNANDIWANFLLKEEF